MLSNVNRAGSADQRLIVQDTCCDICPPVHEKYEAEFNPLHMNWVLVDDTKGNPRAQLRWVVEE